MPTKKPEAKARKTKKLDQDKGKKKQIPDVIPTLKTSPRQDGS